MKTKDKKGCESSSGRVALLIQALWKKSYKSILWAWLWIVIGLTIFPRLDYLFSFDIKDLLVSDWSGNDFFARAFDVVVIFIFVPPLLFNKFVRNSKPMTFALIPANLWEKLVGLLAYIMIVLAGALGITYLTVVIDYLLAPKVATLGMNEYSKDFCEQIVINSEHIRQFIVASLLAISGLLTLIYTSICFKKFIVGFVAGAGYWFSAIFLFVSFTFNKTGLLRFFLSLDEQTLTLFFGIVFGIIDIILFVLIARKLKHIEN